MHALRYFLSEALASLWRGRGAALLAIVTITIGLFVLGLFLLLNANMQQVVARWSEAAELSVYLADDVPPEALARVDERIRSSGMASKFVFVSKEEALRRFQSDFPDLAQTAGSLDRNPFPASFELQLRPDVRDASAAVDTFVMTLSGMPGVADVRYDRHWIARLNALVRAARIAGALIVAILALAAAMTVANVVRLAAAARRDEVEIMQLVGAPFAYVRGPFVTEGVLQGGIGALLAVAALAAACVAVRSRIGAPFAELAGSNLTFLSPAHVAAMVLGGMAVGCIGGYVVARRVR
jgi:cell division transport system permease protein